MEAENVDNINMRKKKKTIRKKRRRRPLSPLESLCKTWLTQNFKSLTFEMLLSDYPTTELGRRNLMIWNHRINEHIQDNHIIGYMALKRGLYHDYFCNDNATETQIISALSDWYSKKVSTIITRSKFSKLITHLNYRNIDIVGIAAFLPPPIEHNIIDENAQNSQQESTENDSLKHDEVPLS